MTHIGPVTVETVQGDPIPVYGRKLTPVSRVVFAVKRRATIRQRRIEVAGGGAALIQPLYVVEERDGQADTLPIEDKTMLVLQQFALVALLVPLLSLFLIGLNWFVRKR